MENGQPDDGEEGQQPGPIAEAIAKNITKDHLDKALAMLQHWADSFGGRNFAINRTRLHWNYITLIAVAIILAYLNLKGTMPGEAVTGFLGTAIGYWLASANRPTK